MNISAPRHARANLTPYLECSYSKLSLLYGRQVDTVWTGRLCHLVDSTLTGIMVMYSRPVCLPSTIWPCDISSIIMKPFDQFVYFRRDDKVDEMSVDESPLHRMSIDDLTYAILSLSASGAMTVLKPLTFGWWRRVFYHCASTTWHYMTAKQLTSDNMSIDDLTYTILYL